MDMLIKESELSEWLESCPTVESYLLTGYREAISDMSDNLLSDPRSRRNHHIVNPEFSEAPKYMMGFLPIPERREFILSCLYVFPEFRRNGYGLHLVKTAQKIVQDGGFIQVAVEEARLPELDGFYRELGFITTGDRIKNSVGKVYQDYFWSGKKISLHREGDFIAVQPINP